MLFSLPTLRTSIAGKARSYTSNATATLTRNNANTRFNAAPLKRCAKRMP